MNVSVVPAPKVLNVLEGSARADVKVAQRIEDGLEREAYRIAIHEDRIDITAGSERGLRYAEATLAKLRFRCGDDLPCMEIEDAPAYEWRSFHIDCARHFFSLDELRKMIGMAAAFKFNRFHWVFSNDQGYRIESKCYPKLHEIGAWRDGDHSGNYHSDAREGGFYTQDEVRELVTYAESLGIEIVPELDMPGHVTAILAAYPELSCTGESVKVGTRAGIYQDIFCAGREEVFTFVENLLDELCELFPGKYFHIGGDETPKGRWKVCPCCQKRMKDEGLNSPQALQGWFINRVAAYLRGKGKTAITWNESAYGDNLDPDILVQLWTDDKEGHIARHIARGGRVILSPMNHCYCDYPYAFISTRSVYEISYAPQGLDASKVVGSECLLWTEYVRDCDMLEALAWPRFAVAAEAMWRGESRPGYEDFAARMKTLFPIFEKYGVKATPAEGWTPEGEEAERQLMAFRMNLIPGIVEEYAQATEEV